MECAARVSRTTHDQKWHTGRRPTGSTPQPCAEFGSLDDTACNLRREPVKSSGRASSTRGGYSHRTRLLPRAGDTGRLRLDRRKHRPSIASVQPWGSATRTSARADGAGLPYDSDAARGDTRRASRRDDREAYALSQRLPRAGPVRGSAEPRQHIEGNAAAPHRPAPRSIHARRASSRRGRRELGPRRPPRRSRLSHGRPRARGPHDRDVRDATRQESSPLPLVKSELGGGS